MTAQLLPGLAVAAAGVGVAVLVNEWLPAASVLTVAVVLGAAVANAGLVRAAWTPGLEWSARRLLRVGVVLLGLRLAVGDVLDLGPGLLALVVGVVAVTFVGTLGLGRLLGAPRGATVLVAAGFSVCGASAVAAVGSVLRRGEDEVAAAIALVTLYGTAAMVALPLLRGPLGLTAREHAVWAGAGVQEVAQVVAAAEPVPGALAVAVVVKLTRVVTLAPLLAVLSLVHRARDRTGGLRAPLVPLFVLGFLALVALRSTGVVPDEVLRAASVAADVALGAALFGLGTGVQLRSLLRSGSKLLLLGLASGVLVLGISLAGAVLLSGR